LGISVVDDSSDSVVVPSFFLMVLSNMWWALVIAWESLISPFFQATISCKVTGFPAIEAGEDFPCSIFLNGSSGYTPFPTSPCAFSVSDSSWEEVFCFCYSCTCSSWGCVHCIAIALWIPPLGIEWFPVVCWWRPRLGFEAISPVPHMDINSLLIDGCHPPLFIGGIGWYVADNIFVHCIR
jgi:hypothetical protein